MMAKSSIVQLPTYQFSTSGRAIPRRGASYQPVGQRDGTMQETSRVREGESGPQRCVPSEIMEAQHAGINDDDGISLRDHGRWTHEFTWAFTLTTEAADVALAGCRRCTCIPLSSTM